MSATRVWTAIESLKKAGASLDAPIVYRGPADRGWCVLCAGELLIVTFATRIRNVEPEVVIALLGKGTHACV